MRAINLLGNRKVEVIDVPTPVPLPDGGPSGVMLVTLRL